MKRESVKVPDLGGASEVEVIEIAVAEGAAIAAEQTLITLESDKASMEVPSPLAGTVRGISVKVGDRVRVGDEILVIEIAGENVAATPTPVSPAATETHAAAPPAPAALEKPAAAAVTAAPAAAAVPIVPAVLAEGDAGTAITRVFEKESRLAAGRPVTAGAAPVYAGPAVRQLARELGITLGEVSGSGPKGRILREDLRAYVKARLAAPPATALPTVPDVDFAAFGPIETVALSNIQKATVTNMARSWLNVPHVTQFDYADVTELEAFRDSLKPEMAQRGNKLTPLPFLLIAVARALREHPRFNASLAPDGANLVFKKYFHVGIAVDTPQGLVVPVIRDVDRKTVWELATEARELADKARNRKLKLADMQGACFTISSLGNIGGEGFTPIVNAPEVAILGVSKLAVRPVWNGQEFLPRKTLPLSLSYDHRVINGADAGNFLTFLVAVLGDLRRLLL